MSSRLTSLVILTTVLIASVGRAQDYTIDLQRIDGAPEIDGRLDDEIWSTASFRDDFTQTDPVDGAAPSERTEFALVFTERSLFLGVRCHDREPEKILARERSRDTSGLRDDRLRVVIDPFGRGTEGFFFTLTAGGGKTEGVIVGTSGRQSVAWDAIWKGRTRVDDEGWTAEFEIPFRSVGFTKGQKWWGFNIERTIRRNQEYLRWASPTRKRSIYSLDRAGRLEGLTDVSTGLGLDVKPTMVARWDR